MADDHILDPGLKRLVALARSNVALEEACLSNVSDLLARHFDDMPNEERSRVTAQLRRHRIGILKQRALLGAIGVDV